MKLINLTNFFLKIALFIPTIFLLAACGGGEVNNAADSNTPSPTYNVLTYSNNGGTITPASRTVQSGQTTSFTLTPNEGFTLGTVTGCGGSLNGNIYTTGAITANCSVTAVFNAIPPVLYTVLASSNNGGSITPASRTVQSGQTTSFTLTANQGFTLGTVTGCGGSLIANIYTTGVITENCSVIASFNLLNNVDQDALLIQFGGKIDLTKLENYANQKVPDYIGEPRDNNNPVTDAGATLGRILFYDKKLSIDDNISCGTCHQQSHAFGDPNVLSNGVAGGVSKRHSMRLINTRFGHGEASTNPRFNVVRMFWDARANSHEEQETAPIKDHDEHGYSGIDGRPDINDLITKLQAIEYYRELFQFVYSSPEITEKKIQLALAQFTKSIQSFDSKYDEGLALSASKLDDFPNFSFDENQGKKLFETSIGEGGINCTSCHHSPEFVIRTPGLGFGHNGVVGVANKPASYDFTNVRAPVLRDLVNPEGRFNGPMMHNGSMTNFRQVIDHYNFVPVPTDEAVRATFLETIDFFLAPSGLPRNFNLTEIEKRQLEAFLRTLSGTAVYTDEKWSDPF
jgi:cytochrome c peroxidase